jgi:hypothetical protein
LASCSCFGAHFDCKANPDSSGDKDQIIKISGNLNPDETLTDVVLVLTDANGADHDLVKVKGPVSVNSNFRSRTMKLLGFKNYILEKKKDVFSFFIPSAVTEFTQAYVKIYFEGTYPDLEPVNCIFNSSP